MLNDHACPHLHGVRVYDMPLPASSGEANAKSLLDVWDCSGSLCCSPCLVGIGISLPPQPHMWEERVAPQWNVSPGLEHWLRKNLGKKRCFFKADIFFQLFPSTISPFSLCCVFLRVQTFF